MKGGQPNMQKTSIVILTYNQLGYTKICIDSIRLYTMPDYEIIVVDNASTDGTVEWLKEQKDITVIFNDANKGFPAGCNQGILKSKGDIIVLLNNDTIVTPRWLDNLLACLKSSDKIGAAGPATNFQSYYQTVSVDYTHFNLKGIIAFADKFNHSNQALWKERLKLTGFCLAVKREVIDKIGMLDEMFSPGYAEDDDYGFRIIQAGYKNVFCGDTFIHHFGNISFDGLFSSNVSVPEIFHGFGDNYQKFKKKWGFHSIYHSNIRLDVINLMNKDDCSLKIRVLEIGCKTGATLLEIKNIFPHAQVFGIETNQNAAQIASRFANIKVGDIEKMDIDYPTGFFDYILFPHALEHSVNPWEVLARMKKYLRPGGQIIARISNVMHYSVIASLFRGAWNYADHGILNDGHLRFFTLKTIEEMFEKSGYSINEISRNTYSDNDAKNFLEYLYKAVAPEMKDELSVVHYVIKAQCKS